MRGDEGGFGLDRRERRAGGATVGEGGGVGVCANREEGAFLHRCRCRRGLGRRAAGGRRVSRLVRPALSRSRRDAGTALLALRSGGVVLSGGGRWRRGMLRESPMDGEQGRSARRRREATRDQLTSFQILRRLQQFGLSKRTALLQNASTSILLLSTAVVNGDPSRRPRRFT